MTFSTVFGSSSAIAFASLYAISSASGSFGRIVCDAR
jgi:hypothetical protein